MPVVATAQLCRVLYYSSPEAIFLMEWLCTYTIPYGIVYESRVEKTDHLLRLSMNRSNFLFLHKTGSADQPGRVPLIEISDSQREQRLENTADGVGLPISTFPSMS